MTKSGVSTLLGKVGTKPSAEMRQPYCKLYKPIIKGCFILSSSAAWRRRALALSWLILSMFLTYLGTGKVEHTVSLPGPQVSQTQFFLVIAKALYRQQWGQKCAGLRDQTSSSSQYVDVTAEVTRQQVTREMFPISSAIRDALPIIRCKLCFSYSNCPLGETYPNMHLTFFS